MSSALDVEAFLDSAAGGAATEHATRDHHSAEREDRHKHERAERRERDRARDSSRDRDHKRRDRSRDRDRERRHHRREQEGEEDSASPRGSVKSGRHRSRSRGSDRHRSRRERRSREPADSEDHRGSGGDFYRGAGRTRSRSRTPDDDRYYRPSGRRERSRDGRRDEPREKRRDDRARGGRGVRESRRRSPSPQSNGKAATPPPTEDERDRRTVFVQQLASRLRTKELIGFFEKVGPVKEAQIVKDRISGRSKGVGYVEFKNEESVPLAIQLTGQKLLGIPIIAQVTEAEKNRQARNAEGGTSSANSGVPFHRLYVGNIHFSITESDLQNVFEPFGELEFVQLQKEEGGRSRGYGFVQFRDPACAKEALEKMNGFDLAGRPIRVGLGNDKFTNESTQNLMARFSNPGSSNFQGSAFSGAGGRGALAGGSTANFDRAGGRDNEKSAGGASALDDTDVAGVNFNNYSRDLLMRKLARTEEPSEPKPTNGHKMQPLPQAKPLPVNVPQASRCIVLHNMFDPANEEGDAWVPELEGDVREECGRYGTVVHVSVDPSLNGDIYLKFSTVSGGEAAIKGLNGRYFGGNTISAQPVVDAVYSSLFSRAKAL